MYKLSFTQTELPALGYMVKLSYPGNSVNEDPKRPNRAITRDEAELPP